MQRTAIKKITAAICLMLCAFMLPSVFSGARTMPRAKPADQTAGSSFPFEEGARALPADSDFSLIRVLITIGSVKRVDLALCGEYSVDGQSFGSGSTVYSVRARLSGGVITLTSIETGEVLAEGTQIVLRRSIVHYTAGYAQITYCGSDKTLGRKYLGDFTFYAEDGYLCMVNTLPMTYYIYGIVGYELNIYCQPEALKAQAVAAQSFAMYYMNNTKPYDVKDGWANSSYQAYRGYQDDRLSTMSFCYDVLGEVLSYNGGFIPIFYGHTNGGETALPSHLWNSTTYDAAYGVTIDDADFESGDSLELISVDFGGTGDNSRFLDYIIAKARDLESADAVRVESIDELYTFDPLPGTERNMRMLHVGATVEASVLPERSSALRASVKDEPEPSEEPQPVPVLMHVSFDCPTSELRSYPLSDLDGSGDDYSSKKYVFQHNYLIYWGIPREGGYTLVFGRRGHGLGLSQIGAETRANPGTYAWDYHRIIEFYYPNFELITVTMANPDSFDGPVLDPEQVLAYGICTEDDTNFHAAASESSSVLGVVNANEHIDITGVTDTGWYCAVWNGIAGYISMDNSLLTQFPSPPNGVFHLVYGRVKSYTNLRAEPYIRSGNVITRLPPLTEFTGWTHIGKWYYVTTESGLSGFISSVMCEFLGSYEYTGMASLMVRDWRSLAFIRREISSFDFRIDPE